MAVVVNGSHPPTWTVVVVRAWVEGAGIRIRLLGSDSTGAHAHAVVASADDAAVTVSAWLRDLATSTPIGHERRPTTDAKTSE